MRILCIEDDPTTGAILQRELARCAPESHVSVAVTAEEGLLLLDQEPFDVVLTDLMLPGSSGLEVVRTVGARCSDTAVIVLTGHGSVKTAVEAMQAGAWDYLEKPIDFTLLTTRLRSVEEAQRRCHEVEEYRLAKELVESSAARDVRSMELRLCELQAAVSHAHALLSGSEETLDPDRIRSVRALLAPFGRSETCAGDAGLALSDQRSPGPDDEDNEEHGTFTEESGAA